MLYFFRFPLKHRPFPSVSQSNSSQLVVNMDRRSAAPSLLRRRNSRKESGHVLITVTICMTVLLGFAGIAADVSYLEHVKRQMQTAADAGALAGAQVAAANALVNATPTSVPGPCTDKLTNGVNDQIVAAAKADTLLNGYTDGSSNPDGTRVIAVTVNCPPDPATTTAPYANDNNAVEVIVKQTKTRSFFMKALGLLPATVSARAVGHLIGGSGCVIGLLRTPGVSSIDVSGAATVNTTCGLVSNADITCNSGTTATAIVAVGATHSCGPAPTNAPEIIPNVAPINDPLASVPAPPISPCGTTGNGASAATAYNGSTGPLSVNGGTVYLNPGTYCGGIDVSNPGSILHFATGVYVIAGGGINIHGGTEDGSAGVMFYMTGTEGAAKNITGATSYAGVAINAQSNATFYASGTAGDAYQGILFYSDRSINNSISGGDTINGGSTNTYKGALYFPNSDLTFNGNSGNTNSSLAAVSRTFTVTGNATFTGSIPGLPGQRLYSIAVLGE